LRNNYEPLDKNRTKIHFIFRHANEWAKNSAVNTSSIHHISSIRKKTRQRLARSKVLSQWDWFDNFASTSLYAFFKPYGEK
jgi:hypothetical protein